MERCLRWLLCLLSVTIVCQRDRSLTAAAASCTSPSQLRLSLVYPPLLTWLPPLLLLCVPAVLLLGYLDLDGQTMITDQYGRLQPDPKRFPSSTQDGGFKKLAAYAHSKGLLFGIHTSQSNSQQRNAQSYNKTMQWSAPQSGGLTAVLCCAVSLGCRVSAWYQ